MSEKEPRSIKGGVDLAYLIKEGRIRLFKLKEDGTADYYVTESQVEGIAVATNETKGIVKGNASVLGMVSIVEGSDGEMKVNGWDAKQDNIYYDVRV